MAEDNPFAILKITALPDDYHGPIMACTMTARYKLIKAKVYKTVAVRVFFTSPTPFLNDLWQ